MKNIIKKTIYCLLMTFVLNISYNVPVCRATNEKTSENFNFIKSEESESDNFIYDGSLLLYGGIALIIVSVTGMILVLIPKNRKKNIYSNSKYKRIKK